MTTRTASHSLPSRTLVQCLNIQFGTGLLFSVSAWMVARFDAIFHGGIELQHPWFAYLGLLAGAGALAAFAVFAWMSTSLVRPDATSDRRLKIVTCSFMTAAGALVLSIAWISVRFMLGVADGTIVVPS